MINIMMNIIINIILTNNNNNSPNKNNNNNNEYIIIEIICIYIPGGTYQTRVHIPYQWRQGQFKYTLFS